MGLRHLIGAVTLSAVACTEQPIRYAAYAPGVLASDTTVSEVLCDTATTNAAIRDSPLLKTAFTTVRDPPKTVTVTKPNRSVLEKVLNAQVSEYDRARIHAAYSWDSTSRLDTLRRILNIEIPKYTISTNTSTLFNYAFTQLPAIGADSIPAALLIASGFPQALASVRFENKIQKNEIVINPFFINQALTVSDHEKIHLLQFTPDSPLNIANHPHGDFIVEGVATYLNERLRYPLNHDPAIESRIREHFARYAIRHVRSGDDPRLVIKYGLLPSLIAHDAITYGPVQAVFRIGTPASCAQ